MSKSKKRGVKKGSAQAQSYAVRKKIDDEVTAVSIIAYTQQEMLDAMALCLSEFYGFGAERQRKFKEALETKYTEIHALQKTDTDDGEYSRTKIEEALKRACGKYYVPHDERYDIQIRRVVE